MKGRAIRGADRPATDLPFGLYAQVYDLLYRDKDYVAEARFVADLLERFLGSAKRGSKPKVHDFACGTGRHLMSLASLGYTASGSDASLAMLDIARRESSQHGLSIEFAQCRMEEAAGLRGPFDAGLLLFASAGYVTETSTLNRVLGNVAKLLGQGGLMVLDVWNGLAVLRDYSPAREREAAGGGLRVRRRSQTRLDEANQLAHVHFDFKITGKGPAPIRFEEDHLVRFFFPREMSETLERAGFEVLLRCPFMDASRDVSARDWNMTLVARRP